MKLQQLRTFLTALETGSFSEAALNLSTSQSTVSYAVAELEKELGVKLLERGRSGAALTEVGERVAMHARLMLRLEDAISQEAFLERGELRGRLRVATFTSVSSKIIPGVFAALRRRHPGLALELQVMNMNEILEAALRDGRAEVVMPLNEASDDLFAWEVARDRYQVALRPDLTAPSGAVVGPEDLRRFPLINPREDTTCAPLVKRYLQEHSVPFDPTQRINETGIILNLVAQGLGVAMVPTMSIDTVPEGVSLLELEPSLERIVLAAILPTSLKVPAVRAFLGALKGIFPGSEVPALEPIISGRLGVAGD